MIEKIIEKFVKIRVLVSCKFVSRKRAMYLPVVMAASVLFIAFASAVMSISVSDIKMADLHNKKITSMSIAEAGINYYLWHLAHDSDDYCDGNICEGSAPYGPFTHAYTDASGNEIGTYSLYISPPESGGSVTTVKSVGKVHGRSPTRTVIAQLGMPSFTRYTLLSNNSELWIGNGEKVTGTAHANKAGVYNEGEITGDASSTEREYVWDDFGQQLGVAGSGIFGGAKIFPVPAVDFDQLAVDMKNLRDEARDLNEGQYYAVSGQKGYHMVLKDASYDLYKVTKCDCSGGNPGYDITQETLVGTYTYPAQGLIFLEDDVWVSGKINVQQVTVVAADPEARNTGQMKKILIPNTVTYTNYDGRDKIGLITQTNIMVTKNAPTDMEIDAAMIAKEGNIYIRQYNIIKNRLKVYGSMAHNTGFAWAYGTSETVTSGYRANELVEDPHNILAPPPKFPTTGTYAVLSWREE